MKNLLALLFSILCVVNVFSAQTEETIIGSYRFTGRVEDSKGLPIAGINLYFQKGDNSRSFATDIKGNFDIGLQPGNYEITVNKTNAVNFRAFVSITEKGPNPDIVAFILDPKSSCCTASDGRRFPTPRVLPRPPYPPAAYAVRAKGEVEVLTTVDTDGGVLSAKAISGHPLLRAVSVAAARATRFDMSEEKTPREVILTYVYLADDESGKKIIRYSNLYRIEIVASSTINY